MKKVRLLNTFIRGATVIGPEKRSTLDFDQHFALDYFLSVLRSG